MACLKASELYRMMVGEGRQIRCSEDVKETQSFKHIREACELRTNGLPGGIGFDDFSIRDLFANLVRNRSNGEPVGESFVQEFLDPRNQAQWSRISEAGGSMAAVDYSMFMGITGQLLINKVLDGYKSEEFIASGIIPNHPTLLDGERWPGVAWPKDPDGSDDLEEITGIPEGKDYPTIGFGEEYIQTPILKKRGAIIPVTREAIFFDRTGLISRIASQGCGYLLGLRKEKRILNCLIGASTAPAFVEKRQFDSAPVTLDIFQYASGSSATQLAGTGLSSRPYPFVNDVPANPLTDYVSIKTAEQYFDKTVDPNTGEPIVVGKPFVFATKNRELDVLQILQADSMYKVSQAGMTAVNAVMTGGPNVLSRLPGGVQFKLSRQLRSRLVAFLKSVAGGSKSESDAQTACDKIWYYGDPGAAFAYMENWPITVTQAPPNSQAEFQQDILVQFKGSERGGVAVIEPRQWQRHNFQAQA